MGVVLHPYDLEHRFSAKILADIFDDDQDGIADAGPIAGLIRDAESKIHSAGLLDIFPTLPASTSDEVKRLALDMCAVYLRQRHPEVVRGDWKDLLAAVNADLKKIRDGIHGLGATPPDPASIHGGDLLPSDPLDDEVAPKAFDDFGIF